MAEMKKEYLDFRNRLQQVCDSSPAVPAHGMGRQTYLATKMGVSQEAARKWLAAESMPRKRVMQDLAKLLGVDEGWLSCGGEVVSKEERKRVTHEGSGAEYMVYGLLTALGATCAFLRHDDLFSDRADITAVYKGKTAFIDVIERAAVRNNDKLRLEVGFDIETDAMYCDVGTIKPLTDIADLF